MNTYLMKYLPRSKEGWLAIRKTPLHSSMSQRVEEYMLAMVDDPEEDRFRLHFDVIESDHSPSGNYRIDQVDAARLLKSYALARGDAIVGDALDYTVMQLINKARGRYDRSVFKLRKQLKEERERGLLFDGGEPGARSSNGNGEG